MTAGAYDRRRIAMGLGLMVVLAHAAPAVAQTSDAIRVAASSNGETRVVQSRIEQVNGRRLETRLQTRIQTRVQSRLQNRVQSANDPQTDAAAAFVSASNRVRAAGSGTGRR